MILEVGPTYLIHILELFTPPLYLKCGIYVLMDVGGRIIRGGIQRATKVSIEARLLGFLNNWTNESTVLSGFLKKPR